jgi:cell wall-associated NlpC family hydrolase
MQLNFFLFVIFILSLPLTGCNEGFEKEIMDIISGIKAEYAPDPRIALFDIEFVRKNSPVITGETNIMKAYNELDSVIKTDYPEIGFHVALLPSGSPDSLIYGLISVSVANLRSEPRHSAELLTQAILGTPVRILKKENNWYLIQTPDSYLGWATESSLNRYSVNELNNYNRAERILYNELAGTCYSLPDMDSRPVSDLVIGSILKITGKQAGFWRVQFPDGRNGFVRKDQSRPLKEWQQSCIPYQSIVQNDASAVHRKITETAMQFMGLPYLWGGTSSKGLDCSGFTKTVYFMNGIILQRDASQQALYGEPVDTSDGFKNLEPADLLFFGDRKTETSLEKVTHVGIYIGDGEFIHSSSGAGRVAINSLLPGVDNYSSYLDSIFICVRRILTSIDKPGIEPVFSNELYGGTVSQIYLNEKR